MNDQIQKILLEGVDSEIYPGCVFQVIKGDETRSWSAGLGTIDTIWDIASLTKVVTNLTFLWLVSKGFVDLDNLVTTVLPFRQYGPTSRMTFRDVLSCQIDLLIPQDLRGVGLSLCDEQGNLRFWKEVECIGEPGSVFKYANYPAFIVGKAIEEITGLPFEEAIQKIVFDSFEMKNTFFTVPEERLSQVAPAPKIGEQGLNWGVVQDPMTQAFLPKKVGIAGIFSTVSDILRIANFLTSMSTPSGNLFIPEELFQELVSDQLVGKFRAKHRYGLGIDKFSLSYLPDHEDFCRDAVVMSGSTGTMLFALPSMFSQGVSFGGVLLANANTAKPDTSGHKPIHYLRKDLIRSLLYE